MQKRSAQEVLEYMIPLLLLYLEELSDSTPTGEQFIYGEKTAYTECLEVLQSWEKAAEYGLDFDIEERYPLY